MIAITRLFLATITLTGVGMAAAARAVDTLYFTDRGNPDGSGIIRQVWAAVDAGAQRTMRTSHRSGDVLREEIGFADSVEDWLRTIAEAKGSEASSND